MPRPGAGRLATWFCRRHLKTDQGAAGWFLGTVATPEIIWGHVVVVSSCTEGAGAASAVGQASPGVTQIGNLDPLVLGQEPTADLPDREPLHRRHDTDDLAATIGLVTTSPLKRFMELRERGRSILAAAREVGVSRTTGNMDDSADRATARPGFPGLPAVALYAPACD